jgi:predicted secreted protein
MTNAVSSVGALLKKYVTSAWVSVGEVTTISGPTMSRETIDVTSLASTGGYREFIAGFRDPGTLTFTMNFNRSDYDTMKADFESDTEQDYELILPDDEVTTLEFSGLVTELPLNLDPGSQITCNVTIKVTGQVTVNSGSGSGS